MVEELVDDIQVLDMFTHNNANSPELHDVSRRLLASLFYSVG